MNTLESLQRSVAQTVAGSSAYAIRASAYFAEKKHPGVHAALQDGQSRTVEMTFVCLDLTEFTRRTFWDSHEDVVALGDAVVGGFAQIVHAFGGYVLGLRGDGLIGGFDAAGASGKAVALVASAVSLATVQGPINAWLDGQGKDGLKAKAGIDHGQVSFLPVLGTDNYNMLGFALNFAAKCEKSADSWGVVVGEGVQSGFFSSPSFAEHKDSPKAYTMRGRTERYRFFDFSWRDYLADADGILGQIGGRPLASVLGDGTL